MSTFYFFIKDDKVFSYYNYTLEQGYPVEIQQEFPGVPSHLDAAVECPKGECITDSVLFFKGYWIIFTLHSHNQWQFKSLEIGCLYTAIIHLSIMGIPWHCVLGICYFTCIVWSVICILIYHNKPFLGNTIYSFDIKTKSVKKKVWAHLPNCTSAFRWLEHYYCFHGYNFTRFNPVSGDVTGTYPKEARKYFMRCEGFGESLMLLTKYTTIISPAFKKLHFILN